MAGKSRMKTEEDELDSLLTSKGHAGVKMDGKSQTKVDMAKRQGTPSVKTRMAFLEAVVRGRGTVDQRFKDWFPHYSNDELSKILAEFYPRMRLPFWQNWNVDGFKPSPDPRQSYEAMLRYKLRIIWHRATSDGNPKPAVIRLLIEMREFRHILPIVRAMRETEEPDERWFFNTYDALNWLEHNTHKLRLCELADCQRGRYFIVSPARKKYCSNLCWEDAEVERSKERARIAAEAKKATAFSEQGSKPSRLTPEGRERIVRGVKQRWEKRRRQRGRSKKP